MSRIGFPKFLLMIEQLEPFTLPNGAWPVFGDAERAAAFAIGVGNDDLKIAEFITATDLDRMMDHVRPDSGKHVWTNETILDGKSIQVRNRLPVDEFFSALKEQAREESKAQEN